MLDTDVLCESIIISFLPLVCRWTYSRILSGFLVPRYLWRAPKAYDVWQVNIERLELSRKILCDWQAQEIDVIIAPGFGTPSPHIGFPGWLPIASSYTCAYNLLDFPAASMPVRPVLLSCI